MNQFTVIMTDHSQTHATFTISIGGTAIGQASIRTSHESNGVLDVSFSILNSKLPIKIHLHLIDKGKETCCSDQSKVICLKYIPWLRSQKLSKFPELSFRQCNTTKAMAFVQFSQRRPIDPSKAACLSVILSLACPQIH